MINSKGRSRLKLREPPSNLQYALGCLEPHRVHLFLCGLKLLSEEGVTERRHAEEVCKVSSVPLVLLTAELCFLHLKQRQDNIPSRGKRWKAMTHITGSLKTGHREAQEQTKSTNTTNKKPAQTSACSEAVIKLGTHKGQTGYPVYQT